MRPINQEERRKAFMNFLLVFLICIAIIITTVFFSIQVPFQRNDQLEKQMTKIEKERDFSRNFSRSLGQINNMLDSINSKTDNPDILNSKISSSIATLGASVDADSLSEKVLYQTVLL